MKELVDDHYFQMIDTRAAVAYNKEMRRIHMSSRFWSLEQHEKITDRFRIFAWTTLWKKLKRVPTDEEVEAKRAELLAFQKKVDKINEQRKKLDEKERDTYISFMRECGIYQEYNEPSIYVQHYMSH